ncbi:Endonuclease/exonuclease/phosphatase [Podospora didyma]|uniref:Endonuclease/exonuclease/phosphatase n=1 Tax=Podospora didyma TaxID=330526 RepID=A0AAE0NS17_9PEZI|nr:Endonuclease/exonuclease/phosphatase [Podospora didyma]
MKSISCITAALLVEGALAATSGKFSILSMNVAGLPAILNQNDVPGDKTTNALSIGTKFAQYGFDVIHAQEDFNYHASIYQTDNHPFRTATSGGVPLGSGLNTLANLDWVDFKRIKWATCSDASSSDCLTPKGFTFMRLVISGSTDNTTTVYADVYNLHADAGTESADNVARQANINQVAEYIATWSKGNAVLVFGDTNSRYSRTADTAIRSLLANGLRDPWVDLQRGGVVPSVETLCANPSSNNTCETVDKVFFRSSPLATLQADAFRYASSLFLQADGNILSDHNPVNVNFTWSSGSSLRQSKFWGGPHGNWFSDATTLASISKPKPATLTFRGGSRLDNVGVTLKDGTALTHGGTGGTAVSLTLGTSEYWVEAQLCQGQKDGWTRVFYIRAATSSGRTVSSGTATVDCMSFSAPSGWQIVGFLGQAGDEVDQLAFVYAPK